MVTRGLWIRREGGSRATTDPFLTEDLRLVLIESRQDQRQEYYITGWATFTTMRPLPCRGGSRSSWLLTTFVSLLAGSRLVAGIDLDLNSPGEHLPAPILPLYYGNSANIPSFRFHQIRSQDLCLQYDDVLHWQ